MSFKSVPTICPYCAAGCGIIIKVIDGRIAGVVPDKTSPVNEGKLCIKGWNAAVFVEHEDRLKTPLVRINGKFESTDWDSAFDLISKKYAELQKVHGPTSIAVMGSGKCTNEENYLMMKFARAVLGTNNIDHCSRLCHASTVTGLGYSFGNGAMTNSIPELEESDCIFIIGSNTMEQHPLIARRILKAKENGAKIIVVDPRFIPMARFADIYIQSKPGTDVPLLNGIMNVILKEGLEDKNFIDTRTEGFADFVEIIEQYPPELAAKIAGVEPGSLVDAARMFAGAKRGNIVYCVGITQHTTGVDNVQSIANLAMLTGNIGRWGTGVSPLRGQINLQGACDVGALPNVYSGYQEFCEIDVDNDEVREKFEAAWGGKLNTAPGLTNIEMMNAASDGSLRALHILGGNPRLTDPDMNHVKKAIDNLEFLVVHDIFMSETAELADVVLPAASFAEKDGTLTLTDRRVVRLRKAIEPIGNTKADWQIICELARCMGANSFNYTSPEQVFDEIAELTPIYHGINYGRLDSPEPIHWPCPAPNHPGTPYLHKNEFIRGKGNFSTTGYLEAAELPDDDYPLILTTGRLIFQYHTGSSTRRSPKLEQEAPEAEIEVHPDDAKGLGIKNGEIVSVKSRRGEIEIKTRLTTGIKQGVVFVPFHYGESPANALTNFAMDPAAKIPELKVCAVRIEKMK